MRQSIIALMLFGLMLVGGVLAQDATPTPSLTPSPFACPAVESEAENGLLTATVGALELEIDTDGALYLTLGDAAPDCVDVPAWLVLRWADDAEPQPVPINGTVIEFRGVVVFTLDPENDNLYLVVLAGGAVADSVTVQRGFMMQILLDADQRAPLGRWLGNRPIPVELVADLQILAAALPAVFAQPPSAVPVDLTATPEAALTPVDADCEVRTDWPVYTVVAGDTLSSIAVRTGSSVRELGAANCLADVGRIRVGQRLHVPRIPPPPTATDTPTVTDAPFLTPTLTATDTATVTDAPFLTPTVTDAPYLTPTVTDSRSKRPPAS